MRQHFQKFYGGVRFSDLLITDCIAQYILPVHAAPLKRSRERIENNKYYVAEQMQVF